MRKKGKKIAIRTIETSLLLWKKRVLIIFAQYSRRLSRLGAEVA